MSNAEPIAVVALGGRFPDAGTPQAFWELIRDRRTAVREVPAGRWALPPSAALGVPGEGPQADRVASIQACFVEDEGLDPASVDLPAALLPRLDPMFRLGLAAASDAWAGCVQEGLDPRRVEVILGNIALPTETISLLSREILGGAGSSAVHPLNRCVVGLPAGLIARALGLGGSVLALDAACASSLFAIGLAVRDLRARRADAVLAGGIGRPDSLYTHMGFSQLRALSPTGRCAPFDVHGDGLVMGEGAGIFVLKRLDDALAAGDRIHGLIRGVGLSNDRDGKLLSPSSEGQLRAMRAAYREADWMRSSVDLIECHATGTPVGDSTELRSLLQLWEGELAHPGQCVIGSVKSNVGHLLTGAGAAGTMKALLALEHRTLPPTAHFEDGLPELEGSPFRVLREAEDWEAPATGAPRRAAVSGFGFGGTNAHVLLEAWTGDDHPLPPPPTSPVPTPAPPAVAVVGMGGRFGPWQEHAELRRRLLGLEAESGGEPTSPTPHRWESAGLDRPGHYVEALEVALGRFRIPPTEMREMLPQQLLMLLAADEALKDAGETEVPGVSTGAYLGIGLDPNTTTYHARWAALAGDDTLAAEAISPPLSPDRTMGALGGIVASRIAREFGLGGPCFVLSSEESSALSAVEVAVRALQAGEVDRALAGAVDLAGDPRALLVPLPGEEDTLVGEGAGAVVLRRLEDALAAGERVLAIIEGVGAATGGGAPETGPRGETFLRAATLAKGETLARGEALAKGESTLPIGLLEFCRPGLPPESRSELVTLLEGETGAFLGHASERVGESGAASGMAGLLRALLALRHRILPAGPGEDAPAMPWLRGDAPRRAAVSAHSVDGKVVQLILREGPEAPRLPDELTASLSRETLLPLSAPSREGLVQALRGLTAELALEPLFDLARRLVAREAKEPGRLGLSLLARDGEEGHRLATLALAVLEDTTKGEAALQTELALSSRGRIACTLSPLGSEGELAFVYPGSGNHFPGMGRWAGLRWPEIFAGRITEQLLPRLAWRTGLEAMNRDPAGLIRSQVALGIGLTHLTERFGLRPRHALGYSLGETAALFSLGAWRDRELMAGRMRQSPLFTESLCGPCDAAREHWGETGAVTWSMAVVRREPGALRAQLEGEARVYLLIVNTPEECVIGGEAGAVAAFARREGLELHPVEGVTTVHCPVVEPVAREYRELHLLPTTAPEGITFYSGARGSSYALSSEAAADAILAQALEGIDFPATVDSAWEQGARIFLEIGPGASCTRMISRILTGAGREHLSVALHMSGQDPERSFLRAIALLHAHRVPLDLTPLLDGHAAPEPEAKPRPSLTFPVGHPPPRPVPRPTPTEAFSALTLPSPPTPSLEAKSSPSPASRPPPPPPPAAAGVAHLRPALPTPPPPVTLAPYAPAAPIDPMAAALADAAARRADAHRLFLASSRENLRVLSEGFARLAGTPLATREVPVVEPRPTPSEPPRSLDHDQCLAFAVRGIGEVLGPSFAHVDAHPTRVRLPEGPLMLVDSISLIEGEPGSMQPGRVVTEHTVHDGRWYLDNGRIPTGVCVESGQADLFLSAYLGIDSETKGLAVYRLLDAKVTFHRALARSGETILHDIRIREFFQQGDTWFFRFEYDSTVNGEPVLTMRDGLAGFFTDAALAAGEGIKASSLVQAQRKVRPPPELPACTPPLEGESYDGSALAALVRGDLAAAFGPAFAKLPLTDPARLPGGKLELIDAITEADERGGWYGRGFIRATRAIHPDDWFLTCHFVDDQVMPGTLMYESALQALRVFLLRKGWVGEQSKVVFEPVPGVQSRLKCRGQVNASTREATYEIHVKELHCEAGAPPRAIADVIMFADGRAIVEIIDMSLQATGLDRASLEALWQAGSPAVAAERPTLYGPERILAYAEGKPSEAFGEAYRAFDGERRLARLPRDPYLFLDRVTRVAGTPFAFEKGAEVDAEVQVASDAWYFLDDGQATMPFAVLLEIALQPCGWLAAYVGSALQSETDLHFRNLGGTARHHRPVGREVGTLFTRTRLTDLSKSGDTIIQHFSFEVLDTAGPVYSGTTYFGFFTGAALANQVGLRGKSLHALPEARVSPADTVSLSAPGLPGGQLRMMDRIDHLSLEGGPHGLGLVQGSKTIDPEEWFFRAHFYQDPVWPGSLGVEAFLQLLKAYGAERWGATRFSALVEDEQQWSYRGQVIPVDRSVIVQTAISRIDEQRQTVWAEGFLSVDGRLIYEMKNFALRCEGGEDT